MFFEVTTVQGKTLINADHITQIEPHETGCYLYLIDYGGGIKVNEPYDFFKHYLESKNIYDYINDGKEISDMEKQLDMEQDFHIL